jgi:hypothetical protein
VRFFKLYVDTSVNAVPNILCVVGLVCKHFGLKLSARKTSAQCSSLNFAKDLTHVHRICFCAF